MGVSVNSEPGKEVFQTLLDDTVKYLKADATKSLKAIPYHIWATNWKVWLQL